MIFSNRRLILGVLAFVASVSALDASRAGEISNAFGACQWNAAAPASTPVLWCPRADGRLIAAHLPAGLTADTLHKAEAGDAAAMLLLARLYFDEPETYDPRAGLAWLTRAAEKGDLVAERNLGRFLRDGDGEAIPKDPVGAAHWYKVAADAGDAPSMTELAVLYDSGVGVQQDYVEGLRWLRLAAQKGYAKGMTGIGRSIYLGRGQAQDAAEAAKWFIKGAGQGDPNAMKILSALYLSGQGVAKDIDEGVRWRREAEAAVRVPGGGIVDGFSGDFPAEAAAGGVDGKLIYRCEVQSNGHLRFCRLLSEQPVGFGFAQAGLSVVAMKRMNAAIQADSEVTLPVSFIWGEEGRESRNKADRCAAYAAVLSKRESLSGSSDWYSRYWKAMSRRYAIERGESGDIDTRLAAQIADAAQQLSAGAQQGFFGQIRLCGLRN